MGNRNELKSKSRQGKNTDQPVNKVPRISPTEISNGQRPSVHQGPSANAKTSTTPSPIKVSENKVLDNQNLQSHNSRKPNDVQTMSEDDNQNLPDVKESLKKSDVLGLDQVLKQSLESLDAKVASLAPALKKLEDADAEILGKASSYCRKSVSIVKALKRPSTTSRADSIRLRASLRNKRMCESKEPSCNKSSSKQQFVNLK